MSTLTINITSTVSTGPASGYFVLPGDFTSIFYPGYNFVVTTLNNIPLAYTVVSASIVGGSTQVVVNSPVEGTVVSFLFTAGTPPFVSGTYQNVVTTSSSSHGSGALVNVVVNGPGSINSYNNIVGGTGYVIGSYANVPLTGGTGTGATATINVNAAGNVYLVTMMNPGNGYSPGDVLSASNTNLGGAGSGFTFTVVNVLTSVGSQVNVTLADGGVGYAVGDVISFTGPFGAGSSISPTVVTSNEVGSITLTSTIAMFKVGQSVYVVNELPANCNSFNRWWPAQVQAPAVQSGTVLQSQVTYTDYSNSPTITYQIRLSGQAGTQQFNESSVYVDKPTAIAAYEALTL